MFVYSCAGTCSFHRRNKQCIITLSAPLLKLRPRKDLVETLLVRLLTHQCLNTKIKLVYKADILLVFRNNTLLYVIFQHEMIHGYLFLTNNDRDRDGHGPNFCKHMKRINKEAGTNITVNNNRFILLFYYQIEICNYVMCKMMRCIRITSRILIPIIIL